MKDSVAFPGVESTLLISDLGHSLSHIRKQDRFWELWFQIGSCPVTIRCPEVEFDTLRPDFDARYWHFEEQSLICR